MHRTPVLQFFAILSSLFLVPALFAEERPVAEIDLSPGGVEWRLAETHSGGVVSIAGPEGFRAELAFGEGEDPRFRLRDVAEVLPEGLYSYQLWATPRLDPGTLARLEAAAGDLEERRALVRELRREGALPEVAPGLSGHFSIAGGSVVTGNDPEPEAKRSDADGPAISTKDQLILDDLIVIGSECIGTSCVNGESFGTDTLRLKEANLRIHFQDTSISPFPTTDWRLVANDDTSGGAGRFSIEDADASRVIFTLEAGAPANALRVDSIGRVGFGTGTPAVELHSASGDTPTLRLEQNTSGSFAAQTWEVAGNETSFFIRDITNEGALPFRIEPGTASNTLFLAQEDRVGIGTTTPSQKLEVLGDAKIVTPTGAITSLFIENTFGANDSSWILRANSSNGDFTFTEAGGNSGFKIEDGVRQNALVLTSAGVEISGSIVQNSSTIHPDYVFEPFYDLPPIEEQGEYMAVHKHLPAVGPARYNPRGEAIVDLGAHQLGMLEELEKAHLYIQELHRQIEELEARMGQLEATDD